MNVYFKLGILALSAAGVLYYGSTRYDAGYEARNSLQVKADLLAQEKARETEQDWQKRLREAQNAAKKRESKLQDDANAASGAASSLRQQLTKLRSDLPKLTRAAIDSYADAASVVFSECTAEYTEMARKADAIDNDRQTLEDAWPKPSTP